MFNALDATDFYEREPRDDVHIQVWFEQDPVSNPRDIQSIAFKIPDNGGSPRALYGFFGGQVDRYLSNEIRELCPLIYLDAGRSFDSTFGHSKWSLFGRIVRQLGDDFSRTMPEATKTAVISHLTNAQQLLRTPLYLSFEQQVKDAFEAQLRGSGHTISFDFRTFDALNFYKSLYPTLVENGNLRNPSEAGSGMRNLIVLALFRAYGEVFKGSAIIAVEEPEIYLHPHAQRSLNSLFETLTSQGVQIFMSTHSAAFLSPERSDRVVRVRQLADAEGDLSTQIKHVDSPQLLVLRQQSHPGTAVTVESMRERYRNICTIEHCEAFFASCVVLVEGPTERGALPIFAKYLGLDFNEFGVSVVSAGGKGNLDSLYHLYRSLEIPVFIVFDNDREKRLQDQQLNPVLLRMLGLAPVPVPPAQCGANYSIIDGDYETAIAADLNAAQPGNYEVLKQYATSQLGAAGKAILARYMARELVAQNIVPNTVRSIVTAIDQLVRPQPIPPPPFADAPATADWLDEEPDYDPF